MRATISRIVLAAAVLGLVVGGAPARADLTLTLTQVGTDVIETGSGTIDTAGLTLPPGVDQAVPGINPSGGYAILGAPGSPNVDLYEGFSGPTSFGTGGPGPDPSSGSGDVLGVDAGDQFFIVVPHGYVSGSFLSATDTYAGATFASLGVTPGTYTWTWGSGATADSLTLQIGPVVTVPEPSSLVGAGVGGALMAGYAWRRRRRAAA